ncbi:hypothetical protein SAMN02910339_00995 [Lachnospiraceae bacterium YSD2013]|nr:hypothetical protein SAMN02910339_00995 [Lachnospiraceae bacterium YSD2013]
MKTDHERIEEIQMDEKIRRAEMLMRAEEYYENPWTRTVMAETQHFPDSSYSDICERNGSFGNGGSYEIPFTPKAFHWLIDSWRKEYKPKSIFIPYADGSECVLKGEEKEVTYWFPNRNFERIAKEFLTIDTVEEMPKKGKYDLIMSDLPFGPFNSYRSAYVTVDDCINLLDDNGYCAFTFPVGITAKSGKEWLAGMEAKGLFCNAIMDMPLNSYGRITTVESVVVIMSKNKSDRLFVGMLADEKSAETLVHNFKNQQASNASPKFGIFVDKEIGCFADYQKLTTIRNKNKNLEKGYNASLVKISKLGKVLAPNRNKGFEKNANSVFVPKLGNSNVVMSEDEFGIKEQNYFQVILDENKMLPRFLAFFLNTEEGVKLRQLYYKGVTIKAFNSQTLGEVEVPCPTIELQSEYLATFDKLEVLRIEVEKLKDRIQKTPAAYKNIRAEMKEINNQGDRFVQWIESLPYPLATILKKYSVTEDLSNRQEMLFYFFEAYSIFESTILSAAIDKEMMDCSSLKNVDSSFFERASFGNWVRLDRALSNIYLQMLNGTDELQKKIPLNCFKTEDEILIKYICNKNVCSVLEQVSEKRNLWKGHGGISSEAIYREHVDTLDSLMRKLQESIKDLYERVRLIRPIGLSFKEGLFTNKVEVLTGSNAIFSKAEIVSSTALDSSKLYLQMIDTEETLELPPYFILKNSPADTKNACYFYSRVEGGNTRYVSYHFDGKPEDLENGKDAYDMIKQVLDN